MASGWNEGEIDDLLGLSPLSDHSSADQVNLLVASVVDDREGSPPQQQEQQQQEEQQQHAPAPLRRPPSKRRRHAPLSGPSPSPSAAAAASEHRPAPADGSCVLQALPLQLLLRLLSFLSAEDLTTAACTSRLLRPLCDEPVLWRRLYCARWGRPQGAAPLPPRPWKARYVERDLAELEEARARAAAGGGAPDDAGALVGGAFVRAQLAKRQHALGRSQADDPMDVPDEVARRVDAWRAARGFAPGVGGASGSGSGSGVGGTSVGGASGSGAAVATAAAGQGRREPASARPEPAAEPSGQAADAAHGSAKAAGAMPAPPARDGGPTPASSRQQPQRRQQRQQQQTAGGRGAAVDHHWCRVAGTSNVYASEATGEVHVCDDACREHVMERSSGLLVCRISGVVREDLRVGAAGLAGEDGAAGDDDEGAAEDGAADFGGRLARAFELGYYADSLEECERLRFSSAPRGGYR